MMKKIIVLLSIISVLFLAGCSLNENKQNNSTSGNIDNLQQEIVENSTFSDYQLIEMVKTYRETRGEYIPKYIVVEGENDNIVTIHLYDIVEEHTATSDWYYIDRNSGIGKNLLGEKIDLINDVENLISLKYTSIEELKKQNILPLETNIGEYYDIGSVKLGNNIYDLKYVKETLIDEVSIEEKLKFYKDDVLKMELIVSSEACADYIEEISTFKDKYLVMVDNTMGGLFRILEIYDDNLNEVTYYAGADIEDIKINENIIDKLISFAETGLERRGMCSFFIADSVHQNIPGGYGSGMPESYYFLSNNTYLWDAGDYYDPMSRVRAKVGTWKIEKADDSDLNIRGKIVLNEKYELYLDGGEVVEVNVPGGGIENGLVNYTLSLKEVDNIVSETIEYVGVSQYSLDTGNAESPAYEYKFGEKTMYSNVTKIDKPIEDFVKDFDSGVENWIGELIELLKDNKVNNSYLEKIIPNTYLNCQVKTYESVIKNYIISYHEIFEKYYTDYTCIGDSAAWDEVESNYKQYETINNYEKRVIIEKYTNPIDIKIARLRENFYVGNSIQEMVKYQAEYGTDYKGELLKHEECFYEVTGMLLMNGNNTTAEDWKNNARAKKIKVTINDTEEYFFDLLDTNEVQLIDVNYIQNNIDTPISIKIEVLEFYLGEKSNDIYISDVRIGLDSSVNGAR